MITFTSTLPEYIFKKLNEMSGKLSVPKNKIIVKALQIYLDHLNRAEYVKSYKQAADDTDVLELAEECMEDYLNQLDE
jgi:hypothetical protein